MKIHARHGVTHYECVQWALILEVLGDGGATRFEMCSQNWSVEKFLPNLHLIYEIN